MMQQAAANGIAEACADEPEAGYEYALTPPCPR